jgi:hypothetical protein
VTLTLVQHLPVLLLATGVIVLLVTGRPLWGRRELLAQHAGYKSLRTASPVLNALVSISVVGKPILEHLQQNNWDTDVVAPVLVVPLTVLAIASVYAMLGAIVFFFFRAIRNINVFNGSRVRTPYSALFMLIPITNLVVIPYLEYFAYQRSLAAAAPERASKRRAALLVLSAFALLVISLAGSRLGGDASQSTLYDPLSLLVLSICTGGAGGLLTTRIISGIARSQTAYALQRGMISADAAGSAVVRSGRTIEALKSAGIGLLLVVALITVLFPGLPSQMVQSIHQAWSASAPQR